MKYIVAIKSDSCLAQLKQLQVNDVIVSDSYYSSSITDNDISKTIELIQKVKNANLGCIVRVDRLYDQKEVEELSQYLLLLEKNKVDALLFSADKVNNYCYLRVFGEVLISDSKRRFVSIYLNKYQQYKDGYYLQEENRDIKMPLVEKESGFWLYGYMLHSLDKIKEIVASDYAGIIFDQVFMDDLYQLEVVKI